jgi:hypothetical protein
MLYIFVFQATNLSTTENGIMYGILIIYPVVYLLVGSALYAKSIELKEEDEFQEEREKL